MSDHTTGEGDLSKSSVLDHRVQEALFRHHAVVSNLELVCALLCTSKPLHHAVHDRCTGSVPVRVKIKQLDAALYFAKWIRGNASIIEELTLELSLFNVQRLAQEVPAAASTITRHIDTIATQAAITRRDCSKSSEKRKNFFQNGHFSLLISFINLIPGSCPRKPE